MKKGTLNIYVGPNGCGKSYLLEKEKKEQKNSILIPTEIVWENDFKESTKNNTTSMDIIINELLLPFLKDERATLNKAVNKKVSEINADLESKNIISNIKRYIPTLKTDNLINNAPNYEITLSKLLDLDTTLIKEMSSGMGTYFIINLLELSNKTDIYIDEPEKFCHPSLITIIAKEINKLVDNGKNITITTHSPKLIKELNWDFDNLFIINTHNKNLEQWKTKLSIEEIVNNSEIKNLSKLLKNNGSFNQGYKIIGEYLSSEDKLKKYLQLRRKNFIDMFFAKNIYLIEGPNDFIFLSKLLNNNTDDYEIIQTDGKFTMPIYIEIFKQIKTQDRTINIMFDKDNDKNTIHQNFNEYIINNVDKVLAFNENLESDTKFTTDTQNAQQNKYKCVEFAKYIDETNNIDWEKYKFCNTK